MEKESPRREAVCTYEATVMFGATAQRYLEHLTVSTVQELLTANRIKLDQVARWLG